MKTPQEIKAYELVEKFYQIQCTEWNDAIQCAKIAVEEIIRTLEKASDPYSTVMTIEYWHSVLECLNKM